MVDKDQTIPTSVLWTHLFKAPSVLTFIRENDENLHVRAFPEYITQLCKQRGEVPERIIKRAGIERSFGHQLFRGARRPSRDTVLLLAFGFEADVELAQTMLKYARCSALYPRMKRDAVICYCLHHRCNIDEMQSLLAEFDLPLIGGDRNR